MLVAVEEGIVVLDDPSASPAARCATSSPTPAATRSTGADPITAPGAPADLLQHRHRAGRRRRRRRRPGMPFADYLAEAVLAPLGMVGSELAGSPAHAVWATVADVAALPRRAAAPDAARRGHGGRRGPAALSRPCRYRARRGALRSVPVGTGRSRSVGTSHRTGPAATNSASTYGHFGGAGTMMWVDPAAGCALVALTDRPFDDWSIEAMRLLAGAVRRRARRGRRRHDVRARRPGPLGDHRRRRAAARALRVRRRRRRRTAGRSW